MENKEKFWERQHITDGAMGTYFAQKYPDCEEISEWANRKQPERILEIHQEYINAGAELIRTNTFALHQKMMGITKEEQEANAKAAVKIAKEAAASAGREVLIAGDIGPIPEMGEEMGASRLEDYHVLCDVFLEAGIPVIMMETFADAEEPLMLAEYIKSKNSEVLALVDFCVNRNGSSARGISARRLLLEAGQCAFVDGVGFNCGIGSGHMISLLKDLERQNGVERRHGIERQEGTCIPEGKLSIAMPNAGYPEQFQNRMVFFDNADYFTDNMKRIANAGISLIGGCCGTTPEYIRKLAAKLPVEERRKNISKGRACKPAMEKQSGSRMGKLAMEEQSGSRTGKPDMEKEGRSERQTAVQSHEKPEPVSNQKAPAFMQKLWRGEKVIAVELDPPYDGNVDKVLSCARELKNLQVDIITMADSPMGRSRADSVLTSLKLNRETGMQMMPHLCCRDKNMIAMRSILLGLHLNGLRNLLLVTGDPVPGDTRAIATGVFDYNSIQLMNFVKQLNEETFAKEPLYYGGALNQGIGFVERLAERMQKKMEAGASYFLTQPIFSEEDMRRVERLKELTGAKILCGIMPLVSYKNAFFIKHEMAGIRVPDEIMSRYHEDMGRDAGEETGTRIAAELMGKMDCFADGYYFMLPFNRVSIMKRLEDNR